MYDCSNGDGFGKFAEEFDDEELAKALLKVTYL